MNKKTKKLYRILNVLGIIIIAGFFYLFTIFGDYMLIIVLIAGFVMLINIMFYINKDLAKKWGDKNG